MIKMSKRTVKALEPEDRDVDHRDKDLKGFTELHHV
jgi:hypothetical protein